MVCDASTQRCRAPTSCTELVCGAHRECGSQGSSFRCLESCTTGYQWDANTKSCVPITGSNCQPGASGSILEQCTSQHRTCVQTGSSASCGPCTGTLYDCWVGPDAPGTCRRPTTCAQCAAEHRTCTEPTDCRDALCGGCMQGYVEESSACVERTYVTDCSTCEAQHRTCATDANGSWCSTCATGWMDTNGTCTREPNCEPGAPNSNYEVCLAQSRVCGVPNCGACLNGYEERTDATGGKVCVTTSACESDDDCPVQSGFHCLQTTQSAPGFCRLDAGCPSTQVLNLFTNLCETATRDCTGVGFTGRVWPVTDRNGEQLCETLPGYFLDPSVTTSQAILCDADQDGWVNQRVAAALALPVANHDLGPIINARCTFLVVVHFVLHNEWGQEKVIPVLDLGQLNVTLYETPRNDGEAGMALPGDGLRSLLPKEVNSLTKYCVDGDANHNSAPDYRENHESVDGAAWQQVFNKLSYFAELHTGRFDNGRYIITERSRCDVDTFPLGYADGDNAVVNDEDYWRSCTRRRDPSYTTGIRTGNDFAEFECTGTAPCQYTWREGWGETVPQATAEPPMDPPELPITAIAEHGLCDGPTVSSDPWRGMNHHSQFRCAIPKSTEPSEPFEVRMSDIAIDSAFDDTRFHLNTCTLVPTTTPVDDKPRVSCTPTLAAEDVSASQNKPRWLAVRYIDYDDPWSYKGGCINEAVEWKQLCPGFIHAIDPYAIARDGEENRFGRLVCGCEKHLGGLSCDVACTEADLLLDADYSLSPRAGFWMCGTITASLNQPVCETSSDGGCGEGFTVTGYIPAQVGGTGVLCEGSEDDAGIHCNDGGFVLR